MTGFGLQRSSRTYGARSLQGMRHEDVRKLLAHRLAETGAPAAGLRVLDIGCGKGDLLKSLAGRQWQLHGCDWLEALPEAGEIAYRSIDLNRNGLAGYDDASFDVVLCSDVIEHLESPAMLLREAARVLKPGGTALISFPNSWNVLERVRFLLGANLRRFRSERVSGPWGHISFFTPHVLESLCDRAGLEIVSLRGGDGVGHMAFGGRHLRVPPTLLLSYNAYLTLAKPMNGATRA
jgi:2-polyprenyl-3-methyl-5-hydroxy-6-metoxy-1,4-benzoquinol methylase